MWNGKQSKINDEWILYMEKKTGYKEPLVKYLL